MVGAPPHRLDLDERGPASEEGSVRRPREDVMPKKVAEMTLAKSSAQRGSCWDVSVRDAVRPLSSSTYESPLRILTRRGLLYFGYVLTS